jgi:hypothetical protein
MLILSLKKIGLSEESLLTGENIDDLVPKLKKYLSAKSSDLWNRYVYELPDQKVKKMIEPLADSYGLEYHW